MSTVDPRSDQELTRHPTQPGTRADIPGAEIDH
jgi:hypothetical protein